MLISYDNQLYCITIELKIDKNLLFIYCLKIAIKESSLISKYQRSDRRKYKKSEIEMICRIRTLNMNFEP